MVAGTADALLFCHSASANSASASTCCRSALGRKDSGNRHLFLPGAGEGRGRRNNVLVLEHLRTVTQKSPLGVLLLPGLQRASENMIFLVDGINGISSLAFMA